MTNRNPWLPSETFVGRYVRKTVNTFFPEVRNKYILPMLDGPLPPKINSSVILHGEAQKTDPFRYMQDFYNEHTINYINKEQRFFKMIQSKYGYLEHRGNMWMELQGKIIITSREGGYDTGEERIGDYIYFTQPLSETNMEVVAFYRKRVGESNSLAQELINPLVLQKNFGYASCEIGICRVSENGEYLAYTLSIEGGDRYICHVRSVDNSSLYHVIRGRNITSVEFSSYNNIFYTESNELNRPFCVMMQQIRPGLLEPAVEIYRDDNEENFVEIHKSKDSKFLVITSESKEVGSVSVLPATYPTIPHELTPLFTAKKPVKVAGVNEWNWIEHYDNCFIKVSSDKGANMRLLYARDEIVLRDGLIAEWKELLPMRDDVQIFDLDIFENYLIVFEIHFKFERNHHIRIIKCDDGLDAAARRSRGDDVLLHFPELNVITPGLNKNFKQDTFNFIYSSIIQPSRDCVYSFDSNLTAQKAKLCAPEALYAQRQSEKFTSFDYMWPYSMYRDLCTAADGTQIPITICHRSDAFVHETSDFELPCNRPKHCLIYVYGAYGEIPSATFQIAPYLWLLRRRWVVAIAHVRGGGELPHWAEEGSGAKKTNSVNDFIACCEHMVKMGYTTPEMMVALGSSAGCVPIAAAMNLRGNSLFKYAIMRSPFVDIINTMSDPELPLSLAERSIWGDPLNVHADLKTLQTYDPYYNLNSRVNYPGMFISASLDDDRVPAWNALKYVAQLRYLRTFKGIDPIAMPLILRLKREGGHSVWSKIQNISEELVFLSQCYDEEGPRRVNDDMDAMRQIHNMHEEGIIDHDDAETFSLKYDEWERERYDYYMKQMTGKTEPNYRQARAVKEPYFWLPNAQELEQKKVDEMINERARAAKNKTNRGANTGAFGRPVGDNKYYSSTNGRANDRAETEGNNI